MGINHINLIKLIIFFIFNDLLKKYKEVKEIKYPIIPPIKQTNIINNFKYKGKHTIKGVGKINHLIKEPLIIDIILNKLILFNIINISSFKGCKDNLLNSPVIE